LGQLEHKASVASKDLLEMREQPANVAFKETLASKALLARRSLEHKARKATLGQLVLTPKWLARLVSKGLLAQLANVASKALPEQQGRLVTVGHKASKGLLARLGRKDPVERRALRALSGRKVPVLLVRKGLPDQPEHRATLAQQVLIVPWQVHKAYRGSVASKALLARRSLAHRARRGCADSKALPG
jgi:hypothetical protein